VLYPAMDGRGVITIGGYRNERVEAVDGFYVIAGHNPGVHGAILTEALASRFEVHIEVTTDWDLAKHLGVPAPAVQAAIALNADLADGTVSWAPYADAGVMPQMAGRSLLKIGAKTVGAA
jgi:nitric oxide reductase NorQ protein